jgi:hypothetical protein
MDPDADPAILIIDLQDANKKLILKNFSAYNFFHRLSILERATGHKRTIIATCQKSAVFGKFSNSTVS